MPPKQPEATKAEYNVLKALWRLKRGTVAEVKQVCTELSGVDLAYTTVMTLLRRLEAKRLVKVDKAREPFVYTPRLKEASVVRARLRQFVDTVFDGNVSELVLQLVDDEALRPEDLRRIEKKIAAKEMKP